jgi:hypothetical protein
MGLHNYYFLALSKNHLIKASQVGFSSKVKEGDKIDEIDM